MRMAVALAVVVFSLSGASAGAFLHPVERVPSGVIVDHSPTKLLILDSGAMRIRDRATGAEEHIPAAAEGPVRYGFLSPHGAIFIAGTETGVQHGLYEWRDGELLYRGSSLTLIVRGNYAIWGGNQPGACCGANLYREDLASGTTVTVHPSNGNDSNDIAPNGDVVYWTQGTSETPRYEIVRFDGTSTQQLTSDNDSAYWNTYPLTDGVNVVYRKHSPCCFNNSGSIAINTPAGEVALDSLRQAWPEWRRDYNLAAGWIAYTRLGAGGELQTWRRSPSGALSQASPDGIGTRIAAINSAGEILFHGSTTSDVFLSRPGTAALDLGFKSRAGDLRGHGNYYFSEGGRWFLTTGNTIYEVGTGFPRPKGATPSRFSLAMAYEPCTAANRVHGPPLAFDSCHPPQKSSPHLTVGTADANARPAKSESSVLLTTVPGNPATPSDEADVGLQVHLNDVRRSDNLEDYTGEVLLDGTLRITDRDTQALGGGTTHGTVRDIHFPVAVPCFATADTTIGATCSLSTTFDTGVPTIKEGRRTIWQLDQILVFDGGPDGDADTDDNSLFAVQGVFIP